MTPVNRATDGWEADVFSYGERPNPNRTTVTLGRLTIWFSYRTPIAFRIGDTPAVISENIWSRTTAQHIEAAADACGICTRVDFDTFARLWDERVKPILP